MDQIDVPHQRRSRAGPNPMWSNENRNRPMDRLLMHVDAIGLRGFLLTDEDDNVVLVIYLI